MVIKSIKPFLGLFAELWLPVLPVVAYVLAVSWLDLQFHLEEFNFPATLITVPGTVIGLLLAFRTNSAYCRWWEARILWGAIVNDSRTWTRQLIEFTSDGDNESTTKATIHRMAYRQIAWCLALCRSLRCQEPITDLDDFVPDSELEIYRTGNHVPNEILLQQSIELRKLYETNRLELYQFVELEKTLTRLTNSMGGCERIKNTVFPESYSRLVHLLIYVFVFFLPFSLVNVAVAGLIFTSLSLSLAFLLIERVSIYLQDPFSNRPSDTPMRSISRTIEINIRHMLGEKELPEKLEAVDGVLW